MYLVAWVKDRAWLTAFVVVYTAVFGVLALRGGNTEFAVYTGAMVVYVAVLLGVDSRVHLSRLVLWLLAVWGLLHMAGGIVPIPASVQDGSKAVLYAMRVVDWLPRYDQVVHAFGFFSATLVCGEALAAAVGRRVAPEGRGTREEQPVWRPVPLSFGLAAGAALMGMGLGAFNEVVEFAATLLPDNGVGGYENTGWDLVSNMAGSVCGGLVCLLRGDKPDNPGG